MQEKEIIIGIGAEAILIKEKNYLIKKRIKKGYRNETLDLMLRKLRTRKEAKILEKVSKLGMCPKILKMNENEKTIEMDFIFFFSSRRRHTRLVSDWSSDVCSSD